jgi:hypothetical protein
VTAQPTRTSLLLSVFLLSLTIFPLTGCGDDDIESPTSPTTVTPAEATTTELFDETLPVSGTTFYAFSVAQYGNVAIALESVSGSFVPATVMLGLGVGTPSGTDCVTTSTINTPAGAGPHLTGIYEAGVYCAKLWDIGNLYAPAAFRLVIAHP